MRCVMAQISLLQQRQQPLMAHIPRSNWLGLEPRDSQHWQASTGVALVNGDTGRPATGLAWNRETPNTGRPAPALPW